MSDDTMTALIVLATVLGSGLGTYSLVFGLGTWLNSRAEKKHRARRQAEEAAANARRAARAAEPAWQGPDLYQRSEVTPETGSDDPLAALHPQQRSDMRSITFGHGEVRP